MLKRTKEWQAERKAFRKMLERATEHRRNSDVIAGEAMALLDIACELIAKASGRTRLEVLDSLHAALDARLP